MPGLSMWVKFSEIPEVWMHRIPQDWQAAPRSLAIRLLDESMMIFSPHFRLAGLALKQIQYLGHVSSLVIPSLYQARGLSMLLKDCPTVNLFAWPEMSERISSVSGQKTLKICELETRLPPRVKFVAPSPKNPQVLGLTVDSLKLENSSKIGFQGEFCARA